MHSRFFRWFSGFVLLAALGVAGLAAPARSQALQAAPAPQSAQPARAAGAADSSQPQAAPTEEETDNKFLQSPTVHKLAKLFHLSVGMTEGLFLGINFFVLALAIGIPLFRWLPRALRTQAQKVRDDIESARKMTADANARLQAIEAKLSGLDGEIGQIRAQVEEESKQDEARIKSTIGEESARIVAAAEQEIGSAAAQARRALRQFAADLAFEQAGQRLVLTPEADRALLAEFLQELAGQGGQTAHGAKNGGQK